MGLVYNLECFTAGALLPARSEVSEPLSMEITQGCNKEKWYRERVF